MCAWQHLSKQLIKSKKRNAEIDMLKRLIETNSIHTYSVTHFSGAFLFLSRHKLYFHRGFLFPLNFAVGAFFSWFRTIHEQCGSHVFVQSISNNGNRSQNTRCIALLCIQRIYLNKYVSIYVYLIWYHQISQRYWYIKSYFKEQSKISVEEYSRPTSVS